MEFQCQILTMTQHNKLKKLSQRFEEFFMEHLALGKYPVYFELKQDVKPIYSRPYLVLKTNEEMFKNKVERLVLLGFL